jgi:hypothetical protein
MAGELVSTDTRWQDTLALVRIFRPWRRAYFLKEDYSKYTIHSYLSGKAIMKAFGEPAYNIGWFAPYATYAIGLDLDCHGAPSAWSEELNPTAEILSLYTKLRDQIPAPPSFLSASNRGLHVYYFLTRPTAHITFAPLLKQRLAGLPIEIKPSPYTSLRIPVKRRLVDANLHPLYLDGKDADIPLDWLSLPVYDIEAILGADWRSQYYDLLRSTPTSTHEYSLALNESSILPFEDGLSNDQLLSLVFLYRRKGLSPEEALARITQGIASSPSYTGHIDDNPDVLMQRITAIYGYCGAEGLTKEAWSSVDKDNVSILARNLLSKISNLPSYKPRSRRGVIKYLEGLIAWKSFQDNVIHSPELVAHYDALYRYYRHNRNRGYYPLPFIVQRAWTSQWNLYLKLLLEAKILIPAPFKPCARAHICKYYRIIP